MAPLVWINSFPPFSFVAVVAASCRHIVRGMNLPFSPARIMSWINISSSPQPKGAPMPKFSLNVMEGFPFEAFADNTLPLRAISIEDT